MPQIVGRQWKKSLPNHQAPYSDHEELIVKRKIINQLISGMLNGLDLFLMFFIQFTHPLKKIFNRNLIAN